MRIVCPDCAATYEVPDHLLKPGKPARCARCGRDWVPEVAAVPQPLPPEPAAPPEPPPPSSPLRLARVPLAEQPPEPRTMERAIAAPPPIIREQWHAPVWLAWVASVLVLAGLVWAGYSQRDAIMDAWPPSILFYDALGLSDGR